MKRFKRAMLMPWAGGANPLAYTNKVLAIDPVNLIAYWPMAEASGSTVVDESGNGRNGVYPGSTNTPTLGQPGIGDGRTCPSFDGGDYANVYSASFAAALNGSEGALSVWCRVSAAGDWTDGIERGVVRFAVDGNNQIYLRKNNSANTPLGLYTAGGTVKNASTTASPTAWAHLAMTWSKAADQMKVYFAGAQIGATQTGLGVFAGTLLSTTVNIGANTVTTNFWKGWLAHVSVWTVPLSLAQIQSIATVS